MTWYKSKKDKTPETCTELERLGEGGNVKRTVNEGESILTV